MDVRTEDSGFKLGEATSAPIVEAPPAKDAVIHISTEDKGLVAYVYLEPPVSGGAAPTIDAIKSALMTNKITYHVDFRLMKSLATSPVYGEKLVIAQGLAPVNGENGTATFHIKTEKTELKPKDNENGTVDYRNLDLVENVTKGQVLCTITLPTEGAPGMTVHGKEIPHKRGIPVPSYLGRNTELSPDGLTILSQIDGHVEFNGTKINVDKTLHIKEDVDNSTGNLNVAGNLVIAGMVLPGFVVEASGDIEIRGAVEGAIIKAGGNLTVHSGVFSSELSCNGDLRCRFVENSIASVRGDMYAESIVHSKVSCGNNLKVKGKLAKIIGGSCVAGLNIEADTIGALSNIKTKVELGTDPLVIARQQGLLEEVATLEAKLEKLTPLLSILQQLKANNRLTEEKRTVFEDVSFTYNTDNRLLAEAKQELEVIAEAIQLKGFGRIVCNNAILPGTTVTIGRASLTVVTPLNNATLYYRDGDIAIGTAR